MFESSGRQTSPALLSGTRDIESVYREHAARMWRALVAFSGSRDVANDAVAEAFAQAIARGDGVRSPERWVWRTAYRVAAGELKRRGRVSESVDGGSIGLDEPALDVRWALLQLSPMQRSALVLHYYAGYSAAEIARITGSTAAAVWVHMSRGRRRLADLLGDES